LRRIVRDSSQVRALGSGHSFSRIADTAGDLVRLDGLPSGIEIDTAASMATVGAGMPYSEVAAELQRAGFALANMASLPHISVAGACATGTHGSGWRQPCLAASVAGLEFVDARGDLVEVRRGSGAFPGYVVALGALGIVTRLTLDIEPSYDVRQWVRRDVPFGEIASRFDEVLGAAYSVSVFTDWWADSVNVWLKHRADLPAITWNGGWPADVPMHPVPGMPADCCTVQFGIAGPWHERLPHFRAEVPLGAGEELQSEFFVPQSAAPEAITAIREIGDRVAPVLQVAEIRTVAGDDLWLSPAYGRDSVSLHFTWVKDESLIRPVLAAVEERLRPLGARPHWGKLTLMGGTEIAARYERADDFRRLMEGCDPTGKFRNAYVSAIFSEE
jgi:xylitol oxidase